MKAGVVVRIVAVVALLFAAPAVSFATGYYRDARDFASYATGCGGSWWAGTTWTNDCDAPTGNASIYANAYYYSGNGVSSTFSSSDAGTYKVWIYHQASDSPVVIVNHNGASVTKQLGNTCGSCGPGWPGPWSWVEVGDVTLVPAVPVAMAITPDGYAGMREVKIRGVYLTSTVGDVPTMAPTGVGGDLVLGTGPGSAWSPEQVQQAIYFVLGAIGAWAFISGVGHRW